MSNDGLPGRSGVGAPLPNPTGQSRARPFPCPMPAPRPAAGTAPDRGPKTAEGKARSAQNALKHGMRALNYVVLPDEDAVEFQRLEAALLDELAPEGALQIVPARRVAVAAWRLARADRMEAEVLEFRSYEDANAGLALLGRRVRERDPNPVPAAKGRQRHPQLRHAVALPRRRHGRVLARAQDAEGAPGRGGRRHWRDLGAPDPAGTARPSSATERTRAPRRARPGLPAGHAARVRGAATARATSTAERTRDQPRAARGGARLRHEP